jgi:hypothetical protein
MRAGVVHRDFLALPNLVVVNASANRFTDYESFSSNTMLRLVLQNNFIQHNFRSDNPIPYAAHTLTSIDLSHNRINSTLTEIFTVWRTFIRTCPLWVRAAQDSIVLLFLPMLNRWRCVFCCFLGRFVLQLSESRRAVNFSAAITPQLT